MVRNRKATVYVMLIWTTILCFVAYEAVMSLNKGFKDFNMHVKSMEEIINANH